MAVSAADAAAAVPDAAGLADPVFDSQRVFRAVLDAMARPGTVEPVALDLDPPAPLNRAAAAVCLTLCDADTPLWLGGGLAVDAVGGYLTFHTGAPVTPDRARAAFCLSDTPQDLDLDDLDAGTDADPDRSATAVVQAAAFDGGPRVRLSGPGVDGSRRRVEPCMSRSKAARRPSTTPTACWPRTGAATRRWPNSASDQIREQMTSPSTG
jgi:phosphonate C-P lyase system protein PhnH